LPRTAGHIAGAKAFKNIVKYASDIGISYVSAYAFSTENWNRPQNEIQMLMKIFDEYLNNALEELKSSNVKINFLGDISKFSTKLQFLIKKVQKNSKNNEGLTVNIGLNYGGREEILNAAKLLATDVINKKIEIKNIDEEAFSKKLYTANQPDVDLVIRTSGEIRISNFMLWQASYAEYIFLNTLWPDFKPKDLNKAIKIFLTRNRRFGGK
jgi:undecaprenyl diphosphate synthase